jgi:RimJ/RimL family protein N-acetyltransferase
MPAVVETPRGPISIRPAAEADAAAVRDLRLEALRSHPEAFASDYTLASRNQSVAYWSDWLRDRSDGNRNILYLAAAGEALAGMCGIQRGSSPKTQHSSVIWGVYVRPDWRGLQLAGQLIDACLAWARARAVRIARLAAVTTNAAAIRCYLRSGFRVYGVEPQAIHYDGVDYDELLMARSL